MAGPYFRNRSWYQHPDPFSFAHSPAFRRVPVYQVDPTREVLIPPNRSEESPTQKSVRIPVHFAGSKQVDRPGSALKIQKVFRGFLVRKCLQKIKDVRAEVDAIEEKLLNGELVESIRRDEKERLKMSERLMSLLFKLDSICGVDFGVRSCRKAVIRKAIALQEKIDEIKATENAETIEQEMEESPNLKLEGEGAIEKGENAEAIEQEMEGSPSLKIEGEGDKGMEVDEDNGESEIVDVMVDRETKMGEVRSNEDGKGDVMERLMRELCDKCEAQTRMINALTNRVELLEKALVCDKLKRQQKKKKKAALSRGD